MSNLVKPRKCSYRRCDEGSVQLSSGVWVTCMTCGGLGFTESDKVTLDARKAQWAVVLEAYSILAKIEDRNVRFEATEGFKALEVDAMDRFYKAASSVVNGHPGVVDALIEYRANR